MQRFPIEQHIVPEPDMNVPEGFTAIDEQLLRGLPHRIVLEGELDLMLVLSSGTANTWRVSDPEAVIGEASTEREPTLDQRDPADPNLDRVPARLLLRHAQRVRAVLPLTAGLQQVVFSGEDHGRALLEILILDWSLRSGNLRGAADVGGRIRLAWRRVDAAVEHYSTPPVSVFVLPRLQPVYRMKSRLGLRKRRVMARFTAKQRALKIKGVS